MANPKRRARSRFPYIRGDDRARLEVRVKRLPTGCWRWLDRTTKGGYGLIKVQNRTVVAHRFAYELLVGPIPDGLTLDHVKERCAIGPPCVNPAHMEPVTMRENILRGDGVCSQNARKTHCPLGHLYDQANTYVRPDGGRDCRECINRRSRERNERRRAAAGRVRPVDRTHCPQGHPYDEANTYVWRGKRSCKACARDRGRKRTAA